MSKESDSTAIQILLVEDNPGDARLVREMLAEAAGDGSGVTFAVTHSRELGQALRALAEGAFQVVLLDLGLPDSQGLDTLRRVLEAAPAAPVLVLSGLGDRELALEAVKAGAQDYLVKGRVDEYSLPRAIRYALERKRSEEEIRRRNRELALLNRVIAASAASLEPEEVLEVVCRELAHAFDLPQAAAALLDESKTQAVVVAEYASALPAVAPEALPAVAEPGLRPQGVPKPALGIRIPVADNPAFQYLLAHRVPLVVEDAQHDPRLGSTRDLMRQRGTASLLILPLVIRGDVIGSLGLDAVQPRAFSADEVNLAWSVADQAAGALARARLAQTQRRLTTAIEQAAESVVIADVQGDILYVNPAFEQITGYRRAEVVGPPLHLPPARGEEEGGGQHEPAFYQDLWNTISAGQTWQGRLVNRRKDGTLYTEETTISPVRDEAGAITHYVALKRDVTRELQLEEQYRQAQKMEAIGQLTAGIAHDFNNLLTAINGFAELLQSKLPATEPAQDMVGKILDAGRRAANLVRQLMAFSRKQIVEPQVLNLNEVLAETEKLLQRIIGEHIRLHTVFAPDLWPVKIDPAQIEQAVLNLAVNARDAMPGGGELTVETANISLDQAYAAGHLETQPGEYTLLAVSDTGVGMSPEVQARIFEPFFTTKERGKGTGLGLASVYGIVKQAGGHIRVYSEEGVGTTFKIYLPRIRQAAQPLRPAEPSYRMPAGDETILLVEDDEGVRLLARHVLGRLGYTLLEAQDGQAALQIASSHPGPIHLLLTDVVMPGMSGKAAAQQLSAGRPSLKILYMSGYTDEAIAHHGVLDPGVAFLQKPFGAMGLAHKVRAVLDG
jgi:PAS domain S-box-containing protein